MHTSWTTRTLSMRPIPRAFHFGMKPVFWVDRYSASCIHRTDRYHCCWLCRKRSTRRCIRQAGCDWSGFNVSVNTTPCTCAVVGLFSSCFTLLSWMSLLRYQVLSESWCVMWLSHLNKTIAMFLHFSHSQQNLARGILTKCAWKQCKTFSHRSDSVLKFCIFDNLHS